MSKANRIELFVGILAIISIALVVVESMISLPTTWLIALYALDFIICLVFIVEFVGRWRQAPSKASFMRKQGYEVLAMIPAGILFAAGTLPVIAGSLRLLRLVRVVRFITVFSRTRRYWDKSDSFMARSGLLYPLLTALTVIIVGAFAVHAFEQGAEGSGISNFGDSLWWSVVTMTTVGYGDVVPISVGGRIIGVFMMLFGIGILATLISQISSTFVESKISGNRGQNEVSDSVLQDIGEIEPKVHSFNENEKAVLMSTVQLILRTRNHENQ